MLPSIKNFVIAFLIAATIFGTAAFFVTPWVADALGGGEETTAPPERPGDGELPPEDPTQGTVNPVDVEGDSFTVLLIGSDYQPDVFSDYRDLTNITDMDAAYENPRTYSADTILLCRLDKEHGHAVFTSIPSETIVTVQGTDMQLGSLLQKYGASYIKSFVSAMTSLPIDYYVEMRIDAMIDIINAIGGVEYNVPEDMYYVDEEERIVEPGASREPTIIEQPDGSQLIIPPGRPFTINLKAGLQTLDGSGVMQLLRYRGYSDGNVSRMNTAVDFLNTLGKSLLKPENAAKIGVILNAVRAKTTTDFTSQDLEAHLDMILAYNRFEFTHITFPGAYQTSASGERIFVYSQAQAYATYGIYKYQGSAA